MVKQIFSILLCLLFYASTNGQSITIMDGTGLDCFSNDVHTQSGTTSSPTRNIYTGTSTGGGGSGGPSRVIWSNTNNRWEVQILDLGVWEIIHYNTTPSAPLAPSLSLGTWVHSHPFCNDLTTFSGTGTTSILPVKLITFDAQTIEEDKNFLEWITASESNNAGFDIEASQDGVHFDKIGFVKGNGTTNDLKKYHFVDERAAISLIYYRLKQIDTDGGFEYSKVVSVLRKSDKFNVISVSPNPANDILNIVVETKNDDDLEINLLDIFGKTIKQQKTTAPQGLNTKSLNLQVLPNGIYFLQLQQGTDRIVRKVVKE